MAYKVACVALLVLAVAFKLGVAPAIRKRPVAKAVPVKSQATPPDVAGTPTEGGETVHMEVDEDGTPIAKGENWLECKKQPEWSDQTPQCWSHGESAVCRRDKVCRWQTGVLKKAGIGNRELNETDFDLPEAELMAEDGICEINCPVLKSEDACWDAGCHYGQGKCNDACHTHHDLMSCNGMPHCGWVAGQEKPPPVPKLSAEIRAADRAAAEAKAAEGGSWLGRRRRLGGEDDEEEEGDEDGAETGEFIAPKDTVGFCDNKVATIDCFSQRTTEECKAAGAQKGKGDVCDWREASKEALAEDTAEEKKEELSYCEYNCPNVQDVLTCRTGGCRWQKDANKCAHPCGYYDRDTCAKQAGCAMSDTGGDVQSDQAVCDTVAAIKKGVEEPRFVRSGLRLKDVYSSFPEQEDASIDVQRLAEEPLQWHVGLKRDKAMAEPRGSIRASVQFHNEAGGIAHGEVKICTIHAPGAVPESIKAHAKKLAAEEAMGLIGAEELEHPGLDKSQLPCPELDAAGHMSLTFDHPGEFADTLTDRPDEWLGSVVRAEISILADEKPIVHFCQSFKMGLERGEHHDGEDGMRRRRLSFLRPKRRVI